MEVNSRLNEISCLDSFIKSKQNVLSNIFQQLDWKNESLQLKKKIICPKNPGHWIPELALPHHQEICEWIEKGYQREELDNQLPDSNFFYEKVQNFVAVKLDCKTIKQILSKCCLLNNDQNQYFNFPKTYERWTVEFNPQQRLAIYNYVVNETKSLKPENVSSENLIIDFGKKEEGEKAKSPLEILAEMRDYKRRRQSYRAKNVHITKKSYTEIMKELIENQTSFLLGTKNEDSENSNRDHKFPPNQNGANHNYSSDEESSESKNHDIQKYRYQSMKQHHSRRRSFSPPKKTKCKKDHSRSRSPSRHKHKKSRKRKRSPE